MLPLSTFAIKTSVYEGPLELLIELVEKRKLLINDISLANVTDEYMRTVSAMQEMSLPNTAQFVALAATLLLIKSKSLLPMLDLTEEEESSIEDLEERLKRYQVYRDAGLALQTRFGKAVMYEPTFIPPADPVFLPDSYCNTVSLAEALERVLNELPKTIVKPTAVVRATISLEEMMERLHRRIENEMKLKFSQLRTIDVDHKNVIVSFLAVLELFKQGSILANQAGRFADIELEITRPGIPRYYT